MKNVCKMYQEPGNIFSVYAHDVCQNCNCSQHSERQSQLSSLIFILKVCLENMLIMTPDNDLQFIKAYQIWLHLPGLSEAPPPCPHQRNPFQAAQGEPKCSWPLSSGRHRPPQLLDGIAAPFILVLSFFSLPHNFIQLFLTSFFWQRR